MDANSATHGVTLDTLMDNAARALADEIHRLDAKNVLMVCGLGNNGGDAIAAVAHLRPETRARILLAGRFRDIKSPQARHAADHLDRAAHPVEEFRTAQRFRELAKESDLIVDALLGSGIVGEVREPVRSLVRLMNAARRPILSVDVPTGLGGKVAVRPTRTVTFHDKKEGMTRTNSGTIKVRPIGVPREALDEVGPGDFTAVYPKNRASSHKGQNGRVLVVAGGPYTGAPVLCAAAAMRSGVDLVHLYTPGDGAMVAQAIQPDLIVHPGTEPRRIVRKDVPPIVRLFSRNDVLLMGPGMGEDRETVAAIEDILRAAAKAKIKVLLDADAQVVAGRHPDLVKRIRPLCTPHAGEFQELTRRPLPKDPDRARSAVAAQAARLRATLLVKGPVDLITDGDRVKANRLHHPAMTTGGTGDVLAGIAAAFWSKGMSPFHAACAAAFVNGDAGRAVAARQGGSLVATDLIAQIPHVFARHLSQEKR